MDSENPSISHWVQRHFEEVEEQIEEDVQIKHLICTRRK